MFIQWILLDQLAKPDLNTILATFSYAFPDMQLYLGQEQSEYQKLMLMGSSDGLIVNIDQIRNNLNRLPHVDELFGKNDPY